MEHYHLRRKDRSITEEKELFDILERCKYVTLALSKDNTPYAVTLSYGFDRSNKKIYLHCAKEGKKIDYIQSNKKVCGTIISDQGYVQGNCKQKYESIVFNGVINIITSFEEKTEAIEILINHLENNPDIMLKKVMTNKKRIQLLNVLCIEIVDFCGKRGE